MPRLPGDPFLPEKPKRSDVAREAGVSESTVSRALNNNPLISIAVRNRVQGAAEKLGYLPNRAAVMLAANRTRRLGLVIRSYATFGPFTRSYFPRLLDGVLLRAEERGYAVEVILDKKDGMEKDLGLLIPGREVDGLLFSVTPLNDKRFSLLKAREIPFVLINNKQEGMNCINGDPLPGMREAFELALKKGYKKIGYITGDPAYYDGWLRLSLFREQADRFNMETLIYPGDFSKNCGYKSGDFFFKENSAPPCIMTASDRSALGLLHYCRENNISVPGDLALIGYDDLGPAEDCSPSLTTIHNPVKELGAAAVDKLIMTLEDKPCDHLNSELASSMGTHLVIRESAHL